MIQLESPSLKRDLVCLTCGNAGLTNAFIHCVGCLDFVVHRYCLDVIPKTFDEHVRWLCDDCEVKMQHKRFKIINVEGPLSSKLPSQENDKEKTMGNQSEHPSVSDAKQHVKEKKISMVEPAVKAEQKSKKRHKECTSRDTMKRVKSGNDFVLPKEREEKKSNEKSLSEQPCKTGSGNNIKEDGVTASSGFDNQGFEMSCEARNQNDIDNDPSVIQYVDPEAPNEPRINPIWRGCFEILEPNQCSLEGFVAHLALKACPKAYDVTCQFEAVLQLEMLPKLDVWPKSFDKLAPSADNIALYFFPSKTSVCEYDQLVQKMMDDDVALRAHLQNAELLLFPSTELPIRDWRLAGWQDKYYIWGVFKGKQRVVSQSNKNLECKSVKIEKTLKGGLNQLGVKERLIQGPRIVANVYTG